MKICPIRYQSFSDPGKYSREGLRLLSKDISDLADLPYAAEEQRQEAIARSGTMSIQGVQLKLSAVLNLKKQSFDIVDREGRFILKPPSEIYPELPENEDLTMRMAAATGIEVPLHGLVYSKDGSMTYFVKRFDRDGKTGKLPLEDFAQLSNRHRETKYDSSMEQVAELITTYCTFPVLEHFKLLKLTVVNYILGNEDMHLKNFSLITREGKIELAPAYDLVNTTIAMKNPTEEIALPLRGKKKNLSRSLFLEYYAHDRLAISEKSAGTIVDEIKAGMTGWGRLIDSSFLTDGMKKRYSDLIAKRRSILAI